MAETPMQHTHPLSIFLYLSRFLYLLLIPLTRGLMAVFTGGLLVWLEGAWVDVFIVILIVLLAWQKWNRFKYYADNKGVVYTSGIFIQNEGFLAARNISSVSSHKIWWLRPLGVTKVRIDTIARGPGQADLIFYLNRAQAEEILALHREKPASRGGRKAEYRPGLLNLVFLPLFTSNSLIGVLFIAAFISQAGKLLGHGIYNLLLETFGAVTRQLALGFSPIAAILAIAFQLTPVTMGISIVLLAGWVFSFSVNLLQTKGLCTTRTRHALQIRGGVLVKKEYLIRLQDINYIDVRQSLFTKLFRLYSVFLDAVGFHKENSDLSAILPFSSRRQCLDKLELLLPEYRVSPRAVKPNGGAIFKFIIDPFWPCLLVPLGTFLALHFFPNWSSVIEFSGFMLSLPAYWFLGVRLVDFCTSGISKAGKYYTIRYSELFYLHTVVFAEDKIVLVNIRQSILQRTDGKCDVKISTRSEGRRKHHVRNLDWDATAELFDAEDLERFRTPPSLWDKAVGIFQPKKKTASKTDKP